VLPTHTSVAGISLGSVGIILGANRAVRLLTNGLAGLAYDRHPRRRLFVPSLFVGALSTALYAATRGFWPLLVGRLLWGLAWSGIWIGGATVVLDVATERDRGRWTGWYQTWFFLGAAFGSFAGGLLTDLVGYAMTMWVGAGATAAGGIVALFLLPETRAARPGRRAPSVPRTGLAVGVTGSLWLAISLQLINRLIISGVLAATLGLLMQDRFAGGAFPLGMATLTGVTMAARTLLSTVAAPLAGILSDWSGSRWRVLVWSLFIGAAGLALLAWRVPSVILVGVSLGAVASGSVQTLVTALTGDLAAFGQRGRAIGLLQTAGDLGSAVGPPVAYAVLPWLGLSRIYALCAALFGLALVPVVILHALPRRAPGSR
jgi:MFS family permease